MKVKNWDISKGNASISNSSAILNSMHLSKDYSVLISAGAGLLFPLLLPVCVLR
jgi:hypothetical protein